MNIYILFTTDKWKTRSSRVLRGAFTDENKLLDAKYELLKNKVVDSNEEFDVVKIEENEYEPNGAYY